ncbi:MAG: TonB-dependent receptor [Polyangia bacterium]
MLPVHRPASADLARRLLDKLLFALALVVAGLPGPAVADETTARPPAYETVVYAPPPATSDPLEDQAASASAITCDRTPRSGESVPQLISELPGVMVTRLGGLGSLATVSLRGSTANQVLVYLDGVPLNTATGGGVDLGAIPIGDIERIEVYRGVSPIGFGASAIGGVVSITTRSPRTNFASAEAGGGSFGTWFGGVSAALATKRFGLYGGLHVLALDGDFPYRSDNGTAFDPSDDRTLQRENNALRQVDGLVRTELTLAGRRKLGAWLSVFKRDQGIPGLGIYQTRESALATTRLVGSGTYESRDDLGPSGNLRAQVYSAITEERFRDPLGEVALGPTSSRDTTTTVGSTVRLSRAVWLAGRLVGIIDGRYEQFQPRNDLGNEVSSAPASRLFGSVGAEAQTWWRALRLDVVPSFRVEISRDVVSGRNYFGTALAAMPAVRRTEPVARLALVERPSDWLAIRGNVGVYSRLPSTTELYGNTGFLIGNPGLVPEAGKNADVGATLHLGTGRLRASLDAAVFGVLVDRLIQYHETSQGRVYPSNVGRARILGVEGSATVRLGWYTRFTGQGTYTDARDTSPSGSPSASQLPMRPRVHAYGRPEIRGVGLGRTLMGGVYADVDVTSGNFLDSGNLVEVPARVLFGAGCYLAIAPGHARILLSAQNLGNSRINDLSGFPLPGRAVYATLAWSSQLDPDERDAGQ